MLKSLKTRIIFITIVLILLTMSTFMFFAQWEIKKAMSQAESESAKSVLNLAMLNIENEYSSLTFYKESMLNKYREQLKNLVDVVVGVIDGYYIKTQRGLLSTNEAQRLAAAEIQKLRFGNDNYFFIIDKNYNSIAHPDPTQRNINIAALRDVNGKYIGKSYIEIALKEGEGYTRYWWRKLGEEDPQEKLAFVRHYPKWNWIVGSGIYIDEIERETKGRFDRIVQELSKSFSEITILKTGYLFVFDGKKQIIIHPSLSGASLSELKDPTSGKPLLDEFIKASKNPNAPYQYVWDKPRDPGSYRYAKESYVKYFPPFDWYIASSVYIDEVNAAAIDLYKTIFYASLIIFVIALIASLYLAKTLTVPITNLVTTMKHIMNKGYANIRAPISGPKETSDLSIIFNNMLDSINSAAAEREKLEKMSRDNLKLATIGKMSSIFVHDVRKPILSIKSVLKKFDFYRSNPQALSLAKNEVDQAIVSVDTMINDVIDFSREMKCELEPTSLLLLLKQSIIESSRGFYETNVALHYQINNMYKPLVDDARVVRAFGNIITNAIEAIMIQGKNSTGNIFFQSNDLLSGDKAFVQIIIGNDGPTLDECDLNCLFETFFTKGKNGGTGLGLASVQKMLNLMGGTVFAQNMPDSTGVEFVINILASNEIEHHNLTSIPTNIGDMYSEESICNASKSSFDHTLQNHDFSNIGANKHVVRKLSVFIVDDMNISRDYIKLTMLEALHDHELDIHLFDNPESALTAYKENKPDIIISDYDFGKLSILKGDQFIKIIRSMDDNILLFLMSSLSSTELEKRSCHVKATGHFGTDISADEFRNIFKDYIME